MLEALERRFRQAAPAVEFCSLRLVRERTEALAVRQDVPHPPQAREDCGAMAIVMDRGGMGYSATSDLSQSGLIAAFARARRWAELASGRSVVDFRAIRLPHPRGEYEGPQVVPWSGASLTDKLALLRGLSAELKTDRRIVDWEASVWNTRREGLYLTGGGGRVYQLFHYMLPGLCAVANDGAQTQMRSFGRLRDHGQQGGLEVNDEDDIRVLLAALP